MTQTVYKLTIAGTTCVLLVLEDVFSSIDDHQFRNYDRKNDPIKYELEICEMTEEEIEALPEFEGF